MSDNSEFSTEKRSRRAKIGLPGTVELDEQKPTETDAGKAALRELIRQAAEDGVNAARARITEQLPTAKPLAPKPEVIVEHGSEVLKNPPDTAPPVEKKEETPLHQWIRKKRGD
ncbi:MAG: hypothetical protein ABSG57_04260 [Candidatus Bathyarchaeia archaeon]